MRNSHTKGEGLMHLAIAAQVEKDTEVGQGGHEVSAVVDLGCLEDEVARVPVRARIVRWDYAGGVRGTQFLRVGQQARRKEGGN